MIRTVPEILEEGAATFRQRHELYGSDYKDWGKVMLGMFPEGITLKTEEDFNRFNMFTRVVGKMSRYAKNITKGGHLDSAHDACVYSAMLEEMTENDHSI